MTVRVTTDGRRVLADIPYWGGRGPRMAKKVPGFRHDWDKTVTPNKFLGWTYPLTMDTCRTLRRVFGTELEILPALRDWARAELAAESAREEIRNGAATARLVRVEAEAPQLALALVPRPDHSTAPPSLSLAPPP